MSKALSKQLFKRLQDKLATKTSTQGSTDTAAQKNGAGRNKGGHKTKRRQQLKSSKKATVRIIAKNKASRATREENVRLLKKLGAHRTQAEVLQQVNVSKGCDCQHASLVLWLEGTVLISQHLTCSGGIPLL
jgi:hypothetical protein